MASKKNKIDDHIKQSEDYIEFLKKALNSENFKRECKEDDIGIKQLKYEKYQ